MVMYINRVPFAVDEPPTGRVIITLLFARDWVSITIKWWWGKFHSPNF